jgi:hypothetical protein
MTDPLVRLEPTRLTVEPGGQARAVVTVRNLGAIVEGFRLTIIDEGVGDGPASWGEITPAEVPVYPQQEASAVVAFAPPPGRTAPSGSFPFAVRATSVVDPSTSAVAEGEVEVGRVFGLQAKLTPVTSAGRWRGRHTVQLTNWGNAPVRLRLVASDADERLGFLVKPAVLDVPLGGTALARLKVRARRPFLRGVATRLPFQVVGEPDPPDLSTLGMPSLPGDPRRPVLDGALTQKPILSRATVAVAGLAVLALAGGLAFALKSGPKTKTFESEGPPTAPTIAAAPNPDGSVMISWPTIRRVESYKLFTLDGRTFVTIGATPGIDGGQGQFITPALKPNTPYCFQLQALRGSLSSDRSARQCVTTASKPSSSATGSPSSTSPGSGPPVATPFGKSEFIAWFGSEVHADKGNPHAQADAQQEADKFNLDSLGADVFHTTKYPKLKVYYRPTQPSSSAAQWMVYLRNTPPWNYQQASDWCQKHKSDFGFCIVVEPNPAD